MFYVISASVFLILIICISIFNDALIIQTKSFYKKVYDSEISSPLYSIKLVNLNESCPKKTSPLELFSFPRTLDGCLCNNITTIGKCSILSTTYYGCIDIPKHNETTIFSIFGNKLCAVYKENENYTYIKESYISKNNKNNSTCEDGYKSCGYFDYNNYSLCIKKGNKCPINDIIIDQNATVEGEYSSYYTNLPFNLDGYYLHYAAEIPNNHILTNISLMFSEGLPCINYDEINICHIPYPLDEKKELYLCKTYIEDNINTDGRFKKIFSFNKSKLAEDNDINYTYSSDFPEGILNYDIDLFTRGYLGINKECNFLSKYNEREKEASIVNSLHHVIMAMLRASGGLYFLTTIVKILKHCYFDIITYALDFIFILFIFSICILSIICLVLLENLELVEVECGGVDQIMIYEIEYTSNLFNKCKIIDFLILLMIIMIISMLAISLLMNRKRHINNEIFKTNDFWKVELTHKLEISGFNSNSSINKLYEENSDSGDNNAS